MQFGTLQIVKLAIAVFVTLVALVLLHRKLKRLEAEGGNTSRIEEIVERYERYLREIGCTDIADRLCTRLADIRFDLLSDVEETWTWTPRPTDTWRRRWTIISPQLVGYGAAVLVGALVGAIFFWRIGVVDDPLGCFCLNYAGGVVALYLFLAREARGCSASISKYRAELMRLNVSPLYERDETVSPPPPKGPRATDDTGMCWSIPRAD